VWGQKLPRPDPYQPDRYPGQHQSNRIRQPQPPRSQGHDNGHDQQPNRPVKCQSDVCIPGI